VATQAPKLREKFKGDPDHVVTFMKFIAQEMRALMAQLGFRKDTEMIGRTDKLDTNKAIEHYKAKGLDLSPILVFMVLNLVRDYLLPAVFKAIFG